MVEAHAVEFFAATKEPVGVAAETDDSTSHPAGLGVSIDVDEDGPVEGLLPEECRDRFRDAVRAGNVEDEESAGAECLVGAAEEAGEGGAGLGGVELIVDDLADGGDGVAGWDGDGH